MSRRLRRPPRFGTRAQAGWRRSDQPFMRSFARACGMAAGGIAAGMALACGSAGEGPELRIGLSPWPGYELFHLAAERGLFDERDGPIRIVEHTSIDDARRAFLRGQTDAFGATLVELLMTRDAGIRAPTAFLALDASEGADVVVARSPIDSPADLRGRRIAVEPGSVGLLLLSRALASAGLGLADVSLKWLDGVEVASAFARSEVDAAVTYPPHSLVARAAGGRPVFSSARIPGEIVDVLIIDAERLRTRPGDAQRVLDGFRRAAEFAHEQPEAAIAQMAAREGVSPAAFAQALGDGIRMLGPDDQLEVLAAGGSAERALHELERTMRSLGLVTGAGCREGCLTSPTMWLARGGD